MYSVSIEKQSENRYIDLTLTKAVLLDMGITDFRSVETEDRRGVIMFCSKEDGTIASDIAKFLGTPRRDAPKAQLSSLKIPPRWDQREHRKQARSTL